jgi:DDE superfamily endonuclease
VPHFDAQELRQYLHQVMATFQKTEQEVVMVVDRSGSHRAHKLDATLDHYQGKLRFHFLPAHCGHHLNPIEVCQTQPIKMTWCPLRLFRQARRHLRGGCKRENELDVHCFSRHDDFADQALGDGLTVFKRELGQILTQQVAKGLGIVHDLLPMDALWPRVGSLPAFLGNLV